MHKIDKMTIIRTVTLIAGLINMGLTLFGKNPLPFSDQQITDIISFLWTVAAALWTWWKNNSFTQPAIKADEYKDLLKNDEWFEEEEDKAVYYEDDEEPEIDDESIGERN